MKQTYITTAIPYVNAAPHIGFALELAQADAIARRRIAAGSPTRLQTGTDENAFKNVEAARAAGFSPHEWVGARAENYRQLSASLRIGHDRFIRTTEEAHARGVALLWNALRPGDVFRRSYSGLYCSGCEDFLSAQNLVDGACPDHRLPPVETSETNHFFRLSAWQDSLARWLSSDAVAIRPEWRRAEILSFVKAGLQDISISRPAARSGGWGIPVPEDQGQVVYVWIDALVNYLSGLGYGTDDSWCRWWNADTQKIHVIGKNVWKFHAVYWPALLLSAGLPLPDELVIHGFLTLEGRKIGKSLGNAVDPQEHIERYGADALRYFLLRAVPQFADADFSAERLATVYESDLANGLGNLSSRLLVLASRGGLRSLPTERDPENPSPKDDLTATHDEALAAIWSDIAQLNRDLEEAQPWAVLKLGSSPRLIEQLGDWLLRLDSIATRIAPFLPDTAARLRKHLAQTPLAPIPPLFPRIREAVHNNPSSAVQRGCS